MMTMDYLYVFGDGRVSQSKGLIGILGMAKERSRWIHDGTW
jgi:hypothetical protein